MRIHDICYESFLHMTIAFATPLEKIIISFDFFNLRPQAVFGIKTSINNSC